MRGWIRGIGTIKSIRTATVIAVIAWPEHKGIFRGGEKTLEK